MKSKVMTLLTPSASSWSTTEERWQRWISGIVSSESPARVEAPIKDPPLERACPQNKLSNLSTKDKMVQVGTFKVFLCVEPVAMACSFSTCSPQPLSCLERKGGGGEGRERYQRRKRERYNIREGREREHQRRERDNIRKGESNIS